MSCYIPMTLFPAKPFSMPREENTMGLLLSPIIMYTWLQKWRLGHTLPDFLYPVVKIRSPKKLEQAKAGFTKWSVC